MAITFMKKSLCAACATLFRVAVAQKNAESLPQAEWWLSLADPCADLPTDATCTASVAALKACVDRCKGKGDTRGHINFKFPRRAACVPAVKGIPRAGFVFDLPTETIDPAFKLTGVRLVVDTYRVQVIPLWDACESALQLWAHQRGWENNAISGTNTTTVCASRRWNLPELSRGARANVDGHYFDLLLTEAGDLTLPPGIGVHARLPAACLGFTPNTLLLQASYSA